MPRIPIDTLRPHPFSSTRIGHLFACNTTLPVVVITTKDGVMTVELNHDAENLGEWLADVSQRVGSEQIESILKGRTVAL